jgi:hypothetical protein
MPQYCGLVVQPDKEVAIYTGLQIEKAKKEIEENLTNYCNFELVAWAKGRDWDASKDPLNAKGDPYDAVIEFNNTFPCIDFHADICFHYLGSIPAKVTHVVDWTGETTLLPDGSTGDWLEYLHGLNPKLFDWHLGNSPAVAEQVHLCNTFGFEVDLRIPQNDLFQGLTGTGYLTIDLLQWTDDCSPPPGSDKTVKLPADPVQIKFDYPGPVSYWKETILGPDDGAGYLPISGDPTIPYNDPLDNPLPIVCIGWCVDKSHTISPGSTHWATLYSVYDPANPYKDPDWQKVAWLINFKGNWPGATKWQFQDAIWAYINGGYSGGDTVVLDMIDQMDDHGDFIPEEGQLVPVVVYIPGHQITFIEVDP